MWLAAIPEEEWGFSADGIEIVKKDFCEPFGDRRCEIVCIGKFL